MSSSILELMTERIQALADIYDRLSKNTSRCNDLRDTYGEFSDRLFDLLQELDERLINQDIEDYPEDYGDLGDEPEPPVWNL